MRYIPEGELEQARNAEPVARYRHRLIGDGVLDEDGADRIGERARVSVDEAFAAALAAELPSPDDAFVDIYANEGR
jgi:pyruvate dehydrogenase E1 component alpha subunit